MAHPIYDSAMRVVAVRLPDYLIDALDKATEKRSTFVRDVLERELADLIEVSAA